MSRGGRICPYCGARNAATAARCVSCAAPLTPPEELDRLWGRTAAPIEVEAKPVVRPFAPDPRGDPSLQETQAIGPARPARPTPPLGTGGRVPAPAAGPPDRWAARGGTLAQPNPPARVRAVGGPGGCVLGMIALMIIGTIAAVFAWGVAQPRVADAVGEAIGRGIAAQVAAIDDLPVRASGELVVTEAELNRSLRRHGAAFGRVEGPRADVTRAGVAVDFALYRLDGTFRGGLAVEGGRLVVVDPRAEGLAGRAVDAAAVAAAIEEAVAALLADEGLRPTGVRLRDGSVVVATEGR